MRAARYSARRLSRGGGDFVSGRETGNAGVVRSGGQTLATAIAACRHDAATTLGGHAGAKSVTALSNELGRLIGALHLFEYRGVRPFFILLQL
jgi:hypothetical protein